MSDMRDVSESIARDWPDDDSEFPDDEKLPWAREVLRYNMIDAEPDSNETPREFHARLVAEAAERGWRVEHAEPDGGAFVVVMRNPVLTAEGRDLRGYGASPEEALVIALADAITFDEQ